MKVVPAHRILATQLAPGGPMEKMPADLAPMHAESGDAAFNDPDWMWEPKLDGYRVLAFIGGNGVKLRSRRAGLHLDSAFPRLLAELAKQAVNGMILDGELVAFDADGRPSFNALQNRIHLKSSRDIASAEESAPVVFYCFDLLHFAGVNLRKHPYRDRRRYLSQCLLPTPLVQLVHAAEDGKELSAAALASGFEGVIGKRKDSVYEPGKRMGTWLKVKPTDSAEFVIGGYTKGKGARAALGALLLGYWDGDKLRYASHVGSGFNDKTLAQVKARLDKLQRKTPPFAEKPDLHSPTVWVEPKAVAEIKFQSWTDDGSLRAPIFLRLRDDVDPKSVRRQGPARTRSAAPAGDAGGASAMSGTEGAPETNGAGGALGEIADVVRQLDTNKATLTLAVGPHALKLTHLDRVYWPADKALKQPALTKRDLLRYFAQVSPFILPHLADRPLTLIRMPEGIHGQQFFQKHWE